MDILPGHEAGAPGLSNCYIGDPPVTDVEVGEAPPNWSVTVNTDNTVTIIPDPESTGDWEIPFWVLDADGDRSEPASYLRVNVMPL